MQTPKVLILDPFEVAGKLKVSILKRIAEIETAVGFGHADLHRTLKSFRPDLVIMYLGKGCEPDLTDEYSEAMDFVEMIRIEFPDDPPVKLWMVVEAYEDLDPHDFMYKTSDNEVLPDLVLPRRFASATVFRALIEKGLPVEQWQEKFALLKKGA